MDAVRSSGINPRTILTQPAEMTTMACMKTIAQLATESGRLGSSLTRIARKLGFSKRGRDYELTEKQAVELLAELRDKPGCPLFGKNFADRKAKLRNGVRHNARKTNKKNGKDLLRFRTP